MFRRALLIGLLLLAGQVSAALVTADRVLETTTTSGTDTLELIGAQTGYQTFVSGVGNGNTCYYAIEQGADWEVGLGTVTDGSPDTLSRDSVVASSNAGNKISLSGATARVYVTFPGDAAAMRASIGTVIGTDVQAFDADLSDLADGELTGSKVGTGINGDNVTSGTVADARIASTITRDSEAAAAYSALGHTHGASTLDTDSVSADELNATGVEAELEAVLDLQDLQGAVIDSQVPNNITVDLATVATTANAGDSATAFFSSGAVEEARIDSVIARDSEVAAGYQPLDADLTDLADGSISGDKVSGGTITTFASTGIDDNADTSFVVLDSSEQLTIGHTANVLGSGYGTDVEIHDSASAAAIGLISWDSTPAGASLLLGASDSNTIGTYDVLESGENAGFITFLAPGTVPGNGFFDMATILAEADANHDGANSPGRLVFFTDGASGSNTEAMRIDSAQNVGIGDTSPDARLHVTAGAGAGAVVIRAQIDDDDTTGSVLRMHKNSSTPADNDVIGIADFIGNDDAVALNETRFARIRAIALDVSDGTEDGELRLDVTQNASSVTALNLNGDGVTSTIQPSFLAYNSSQDANVTGNTTVATVGFDTEVRDQGADFASDTFTAPVAGSYLLTTCVTATGVTAAADEAYLTIDTSNRDYVSRTVDTNDLPTRWSECITTIADMDAADTAIVSTRFDGEASNVVDVEGSASPHVTFFAGALLH